MYQLFYISTYGTWWKVKLFHDNTMKETVDYCKKLVEYKVVPGWAIIRRSDNVTVAQSENLPLPTV